MSGSRIRSIETSHIADLIRIADETNLNRWSAEAYLDELKNQHAIMLCLVSETNETRGFIVGRIVLAADDDFAVDAEIYNIGIEPSKQRNGFGQMLIDSFVAKCLTKNVRDIWLEVRESNTAAINIYQKNGFRRTAIRKDFYSDPRENAILMCRRV